MPIYCYKCLGCGEIIEELSKTYGDKGIVFHNCGQGNCAPATRHVAAELPVAHSQGDFHFTPHFDDGAGQRFDTKAEYTAWQAANTDADGCAPEPLEGRRKVSRYEEALHACHVNQKVQVDEKAERAALGKAWDAAHRELAACQAMGVKPPSLED